MSEKSFMIGPLDDGRSESHAQVMGDKWCVGCLAMWTVNLAERLTPENAMLGHQVILLHELTHNCTPEDHKDSWDWFLCELLGGKPEDIWPLYNCEN